MFQIRNTGRAGSGGHASMRCMLGGQDVSGNTSSEYHASAKRVWMGEALVVKTILPQVCG